MPSKRFDFLDQRPLFREDMNRAEQSRMNKRRMEVQRAAPSVAADEAKTPQMKERLSNLRPKAETRSQVVSRLADNLMNPKADLRLNDESMLPDADWYARVHSVPIHRIAEETGVHPERVATSSAAMSPQNDPTSERAAARAIAQAESRNEQFHISQQFKDVLPSRSPVQEIPVGSVGFSEMTPEQIRDASKAEHRDSGIVQADVDLKGLAKAGPNKVAGVRGMRGESMTELAPPSSAPKVHTYGRHSYSFGVPHKTDSGKGSTFSPTDNTVAEEIRFRAKHAATQIPGQTTIAVNDMYDDHVEMTKELHDHLTSRGAPVRGQQIGSRVRVRDLHPAAVLTMSHPDVSDVHQDGDRMQRLAKVSSNLPAVIDSWANADMHGYAEQDPKAAKPTGSNRAGYWSSKSLSDGTNIVDDADPRVTSAGLQHAEYDSLYRAAARKITEDMDMDIDYPSTAAQAGAWTGLRRSAGADPQFNASKRQEEKSAKSPKNDKIKGQQEMKFPGWKPQ
jgi:hypothetical protein